MMRHTDRKGGEGNDPSAPIAGISPSGSISVACLIPCFSRHSQFLHKVILKTHIFYEMSLFFANIYM